MAENSSCSSATPTKVNTPGMELMMSRMLNWTRRNGRPQCRPSTSLVDGRASFKLRKTTPSSGRCQNLRSTKERSFHRAFTSHCSTPEKCSSNNASDKVTFPSVWAMHVAPIHAALKKWKKRRTGVSGRYPQTQQEPALTPQPSQPTTYVHVQNALRCSTNSE